MMSVLDASHCQPHDERAARSTKVGYKRGQTSIPKPPGKARAEVRCERRLLGVVARGLLQALLLKPRRTDEDSAEFANLMSRVREQPLLQMAWRDFHEFLQHQLPEPANVVHAARKRAARMQAEKSIV